MAADENLQQLTHDTQSDECVTSQAAVMEKFAAWFMQHDHNVTALSTEKLVLKPNLYYVRSQSVGCGAF